VAKQTFYKRVPPFFTVNLIDIIQKCGRLGMSNRLRKLLVFDETDYMLENKFRLIENLTIIVWSNQNEF